MNTIEGATLREPSESRKLHPSLSQAPQCCKSVERALYRRLTLRNYM